MTDPTERRMGLGALTDTISPDRVVGIPVGEVRALAYDSRTVAPGTLFFAVPGDHMDGHDFVVDAVAAEAVGDVVERELPGVAVPLIMVDRTRRALADAADAWFGRPSERLTVVGVTAGVCEEWLYRGFFLAVVAALLGGAGTWLLPRIVGLPTALRLLYSGEFVDAVQ